MIFEIEEKPNGGIVGDNNPIGNLGDSTFKINEDNSDTSTELQNVCFDITGKCSKNWTM